MRPPTLIHALLLAGAVMAALAPAAHAQMEPAPPPATGPADRAVNIGEEGLGGVGVGTGRRLREDALADTGFGPAQIQARDIQRVRAETWEQAEQMAEAKRLGSEQVGMQDLEREIQRARERAERQAERMVDLTVEERDRLEKARERIEKREAERWERAREAGEAQEVRHARIRLDPDVVEQMSLHDRARLRMYTRAAISEGFSRGMLARLTEGEGRRLAQRTGPATDLYAQGGTGASGVR